MRIRHLQKREAASFSLWCRIICWVSRLSPGVPGQLVSDHWITGTSFRRPKVIGCTVHKFINSPVVTGTLRGPLGSKVELTTDLAGLPPHHCVIRRFPSELLTRPPVQTLITFYWHVVTFKASVWKDIRASKCRTTGGSLAQGPPRLVRKDTDVAASLTVWEKSPSTYLGKRFYMKQAWK